MSFFVSGLVSIEDSIEKSFTLGNSEIVLSVSFRPFDNDLKLVRMFNIMLERVILYIINIFFKLIYLT